MITGHTNAAQQAAVSVTVVGPTGLQQSVEAVVDTGFTGFLMLPPHLIITLLPVYERTRSMILANNQRHVFHSYRGAEVILDGQRYPASVLMKEGHSLMGMALLKGRRLCLDITAGGEVRLERLPRTQRGRREHGKGKAR